MPPTTRIRIEVSGRVQKVFFRHTTKKIAGTLGLSGWVKNQGDGQVLCEAQGERILAEQFVLFLMRGPRLARVEKLSIEFIDPVLGEEGFQIAD